MTRCCRASMGSCRVFRRFKTCPRIAEAQQVLQAAVDDAAQAITEARDAVQDLRSSTVTNDLAKAIEALGQELNAYQTSANGAATDFSVQVNGTPQDLHP